MLSKKEIETRNKCDRYMCRGILKGKSKWIYGYTWKDSFGMIYILDLEGHTWEIQEETLSQCTGESDKNGVIIFENDIVSFDVDGCFGVIKYDEKSSGFGYIAIDESYHIGLHKSNNMIIIEEVKNVK